MTYPRCAVEEPEALVAEQDLKGSCRPIDVGVVHAISYRA
jgi:hypothetical protein